MRFLFSCFNLNIALSALNFLLSNAFVNVARKSWHLESSLIALRNQNNDDLTLSEEYFGDMDDPYGGIFNMKIPIGETENEDLVSTWSIDNDAKMEVVAKPTQESIKQFRPKKDKSADAFGGFLNLEEQNVPEWLKEARDVIEMQRGYAIWSKRSDVEIQREIKKAAANRALMIPDKVATIVRMVHLERTDKLAALRKDRKYELACIDYRKWLADQRKRTKKDPIPIAKVEVSKRWLTEHPSLTTSSVAVVMDDRKEPLYGVVMEAASGKGSSGVMTTSSMLNWDKTLAELVVANANTISTRSETAVVSAEGGRKGQWPELKIDNHEMFAVTDDEFFVVL